MTKTLEQIQQENRKFILEAIHGCSYEEALKKELGVGCKVKIKRFMSAQNFNEEIFVIDYYCEFFTENLFRTIGAFHHNEIIEIIGKPLTLSRVLLGFLKADKPIGATLAINKSGFYINLRNEIPWDIKFETLEEQTEEVQTKINELFTN